MRARLRERLAATIRSEIRKAYHEELVELVRSESKAISTRTVQETIAATPVLWAKHKPLNPAADPLKIERSPVRVPSGARVERAHDFPLPPEDFWGTPPPYVDGGGGQVERMFECLREAGLRDEEVRSVLDFGCGTGRLLTHFLPHAYDHEVWGADIDGERIGWAQQHLSPPFHFLACSTAPSLPFETGRFSLVYAGSVFTHMDEDTDAWLLELLRVTEPGGYLYITIQDQDWIDATLERGRDDWLTQFLDGNRSLLDELGSRYSMLAFARGGPEAMVIHDRAALVARWSGYADVVSVTSRAFFSQSALVLRRRR